MSFFCEYCGTNIDTNKDKICPSCGASYKKNKEYLRQFDEMNKQRQSNQAFQNDVKKHVLKGLKVGSIAFIMPMIISAVVFVVIMFVFVSIFTQANGQIKNNNNNNIFDNFKEITVNMNEYAETKNYKVKVTGYEVVEFWHKEAKEGYEFIKFNLMVENLTEDEISNEDVNCIVDGVVQTNEFSSGYSDLPFFIDRKLTVTGTSTFEVPKNADSYDIRYGDYVTIHIEK